ncbi:LacI family DNA-binding transcriptional regulator [Cucumibacter marinus]|uniref:LacI family DNA-binding transcriptional regulator n=1 Tax=Cucumibacter marinus TaxID=1121252 RepID=UPI0003F9BD62|nr:LacI family DNA-binding transcriptional regulator [Cucumibacter marinus]
MASRARIRDIAERAGVSTATVSRALSDSSLVAKATRDMIKKTAEALDYRPNVTARNLRIQRSMSVLLVVRDMSNPFYLEVFKGVEATARAAGYSVLMGNTENDAERERDYFNMLQDGHADGMILMTGKLPADNEPWEAGSPHPPIVVALEMIEGAGLPHVQIDNVSASRRATEHLIELGHTRIAHIAGPIPEQMSVRRRKGYREAMKAAGLAIPKGFEVKGDFSLASGRAACKTLFSGAETPTAIFCANDEMAFGAINELRQMGRSVPEDVSVVGFDDIMFAEAFYPPLTTVSQPRAEIGARAMAELLTVMNGEAMPPRTIEVPATLTIRGSTAAPGGA